ncbi:MAG: hypothetical protein H0U07_14950 [Actinobacteria bacterium]|nr:hypothetical protein [Actinomycetota bacterium]
MRGSAPGRVVPFREQTPGDRSVRRLNSAALACTARKEERSGGGGGDPRGVRVAWKRAVNASLLRAVIVLGFAALAKLPEIV